MQCTLRTQIQNAEKIFDLQEQYGCVSPGLALIKFNHHASLTQGLDLCQRSIHERALEGFPELNLQKKADSLPENAYSEGLPQAGKSRSVNGAFRLGATQRGSVSEHLQVLPAPCQKWLQSPKCSGLHPQTWQVEKL